MNTELSHAIVIGLGIIGATVLGAVWILHGGDGIAMTGYFSIVGSLVGYEFGSRSNAITNTSVSK